MQRIWLAVLIVLTVGLAVAFGFYQGKKWDGYKLSRVVDGDTISVINLRDNREWRLRIWGINAPDQKQCFWEESRIELEKQLAGKEVSYQIFGYDGYGRILAKVFVNGADLGEIQIKNGAASVYDAAEVHDDLKPSMEYVNFLRQSEEAARANRLGIWGSNCVKK